MREKSYFKCSQLAGQEKVYSTHWVSLADINRDGYLDARFAISIFSDTDLRYSTCFGNGNGFLPCHSQKGGQFAYSITFGDVNNDNLLDMGVATARNFKPIPNEICFGTGNGTTFDCIDTPPNSAAYSSTREAFADFNQDGFLDLAITYSGGSNEICLGNGTGIYKNCSILDPYVDDADSADLLIGDVNNDGNLDILIINQSGGGSRYYDELCYGNGKGDFSCNDLHVAGGSSGVLADLNYDNNLDLVTVTGNQVSGRGSYQVCLGNGLGGFDCINAVLLDYYCNQVKLGDLNNDGNVDMVIATGNYYDSHYQPNIYCLGLGDGTFANCNNIAADKYWSAGVELSDVNGDNKIDIVFANSELSESGTGSGLLCLNMLEKTNVSGSIAPPTSSLKLPQTPTSKIDIDASSVSNAAYSPEVEVNSTIALWFVLAKLGRDAISKLSDVFDYSASAEKSQEQTDSLNADDTSTATVIKMIQNDNDIRQQASNKKYLIRLKRVVERKLTRLPHDAPEEYSEVLEDFVSDLQDALRKKTSKTESYRYWNKQYRVLKNRYERRIIPKQANTLSKQGYSRYATTRWQNTLWQPLPTAKILPISNTEYVTSTSSSMPRLEA